MNRKMIWMLAAISLVVLISGCSTSTPTQAPNTATPEPTATSVPPTTTPQATATSEPEPEEETPDPTTTPEPPTPTPTVVYADTAQYRLTFEATWSAATHPTDFPGNPHWSGLVGAVHSADAVLWAEGQPSSPGIKSMAETGAKRQLEKEAETFIDAGTACEVISGKGVAVSPGSVSVEFSAMQDCSLLSVVTMIAPSPDWFVGTSGLPLFDEQGWVETLEVELYPWDAGTDSGETYTSRNAATNPAQAISMITGTPLLNGDNVPFLGIFRIEKIGE